jgi:hypothetical protein
MEKVEIRAVIKYLCKKGMSPKEIHEDFIDTLGKVSPSYSTVNWLLNLRGAGRALEVMSGMGGQKRQPTLNCRSRAQSGHVRQKARPAMLGK